MTPYLIENATMSKDDMRSIGDIQAFFKLNESYAVVIILQKAIKYLN
jgi:hypothetical protein